jgi:vacuolar-type H+-ATPase subunit F/Vma7
VQVRLIGDARDVTGFALAGVESQECETGAGFVRALDEARRDPDVAIVVVSASLASFAEDLIEEMRESVHLPIVIVLPALPADDPAAAETPA